MDKGRFWIKSEHFLRIFATGYLRRISGGSKQDSEGRIGMYIILLLLWIIFNGRVTLEILILGALICAALYRFMCRHMGYSMKKDMKRWKMVPYLLKYAVTLVCEIVKANLAVIRIILSPKLENESELVHFRVTLKSELARAALANSITLTPGTITVSVKNGFYAVHALDKPFGEGLAQCEFAKQLKKMEEIDS